jgi:hypothetical protein
MTTVVSQTHGLTRQSAEGDDPDVLTRIYQDDANMVVWKRSLDTSVMTAASQLLLANPALQMSMTVSPDSAFSSLFDALGKTEVAKLLAEDMAQLVDMFCCLFDIKRVGLRFTALDRAMCPKFHVDRVPCRLVTTYHGIATEWLPHHCVDRSKLGRGSEGKSDEQSGIFSHIDDIQQLHSGDVALLKGENWEGNEGAGLVHRSPFISALSVGDNVQSTVQTSGRRLLLTLDFSH